MESVETDLLTYIRKQWTLAKFYTLPTKLTTKLHLDLFRSVEENLSISGVLPNDGGSNTTTTNLLEMRSNVR